MDAGLLLGFGFIILSASSNGLLALPQKYVKRFAWENTWGAFYLFTMVLIPAVFAALFLKGVFPTWSQAGALNLIVLLMFGVLWGTAMILFGIGISLIGMSLGYAIMMGLGVLVGSLTPLLVQHPEQAPTPGGILIMVGIGICTIGVALCGRAGILREVSQAKQASNGAQKPRNMAKGLVVSVIGGILGACINLGFSYGNTMIEASMGKYGNSPGVAALTVWMLVFWGGFLPSGIYSIYLLFRNRTWGNFAGPGSGRDLLMSFLMGMFHFSILFCLGMAAFHLGKLGASVGWAAHMSLSLVLANLLGFLTGEWAGSSSRSRNWLFSGLAALIGGIVVLGTGNSMLQ